jgi:hypothetical protein
LLYLIENVDAMITKGRHSVDEGRCQETSVHRYLYQVLHHLTKASERRKANSNKTALVARHTANVKEDPDQQLEGLGRTLALELFAAERRQRWR